MVFAEMLKLSESSPMVRLLVKCRQNGLLTAQEYESRNRTFTIDVRLDEKSWDEAEKDWNAVILEKYIREVVAFDINVVHEFLSTECCVNLQLDSGPRGREAVVRMRNEYRHGFDKSGYVAQRRRELRRAQHAGGCCDIDF